MQIVVIVTALLNVIVRIVKMFRSKKTTDRSNVDRESPVGSSPARQPKQGEWTPPRDEPSTRADSPRPPTMPIPTTTGTDGGIGALFKKKQSNVIVQAAGEVVHVLPDDSYDLDGSGLHQNFLVELMGNVTVKVSHNLEFGRIPISKGDIVSFKGEYEWSEKGGTIHWTHHDPKGWHEDGWVEINGQRFG